MTLDTVQAYLDVISGLPDHEIGARCPSSDLRIAAVGNGVSRLSVFYAPFDYINEQAKICIIGITPGLTQMTAATRELKRCLRVRPEGSSRIAELSQHEPN